jgi:hypothetical protein
MITNFYRAGGQFQAAGSSYDADAEALFARMTTPPTTGRKDIINDVFVQMKAEGIYSLITEMGFLAAADEQAALLGWKDYADTTKISTPSFTADRGFTGDTSNTLALDTGVNPSTAPNVSLTSASIGVYSRTNSGATVSDIGSRTTTSSNQFILIPRNASNVFQNRVVIGSGTGFTTANNDSTGLLVGNRSGSDAIESYRNGSSLATGTNSNTGVSLPDLNIYVLAANTNGSVSVSSGRECAFWFVGGSMDSTQQAALYTIVQDYMTAVGADV